MENDITTRAMLAGLNISAWSASKQDRAVTQEVHDNHQAAPDAGRYTKALLAKAALSSIRTIATAARSYHYDMTLPWAEDGGRLLPATLYMDYAKNMASMKNQFDQAVSDFLAGYAEHVEDAKTRLGTMFNEKDYPADVKDKFKFGVTILPLPAASDFRVSLGKEHEEEIKANIEIAMQESTQMAMSDLWHRVHDVIAHMRDKLRDYKTDENGKVIAGIFRDSTIENVRALVTLLPKLNITDDPILKDLRADLEDSLQGLDVQDLREDDMLRETTTARVTTMLEVIEKRAA